MNYFYSNNISNESIILEKEEMIHCTKVLRKKVNDTVFIVDGAGSLFYSQILRKTTKDIRSSGYKYPKKSIWYNIISNRN